MILKCQRYGFARCNKQILPKSALSRLNQSDN